ncbi:unnamed protein product [Symbiodinium necroappetens]|uniref:Uncharacterized protein n=1 Tax=Symbiodinium necroappetens TaxID=1628268 RepID=A0A812K1X0_9DINO|nr:unnamed protein product [Symbiodinium necroappetens]
MAESPACSEGLRFQSCGLDKASVSIQTQTPPKQDERAINGPFQKHCCLAMAMAVATHEFKGHAALAMDHLTPSILAQLLAAVVQISARDNTLSVAVLHTLQKHHQTPPKGVELCFTPKFASCSRHRFSELCHPVIPITLLCGRTASGKKAGDVYSAVQVTRRCGTAIFDNFSLPFPAQCLQLSQAQLAKLVSMFFLQVHQKLIFVQLTLQCAATCGLDL